MPSQVGQFSPRSTLIERGEALRQSTMIADGFMIRYIDDLEGRRQMVAFDTFLHVYPDKPVHRGCFGNLAEALQPYGICADRIPTP